MYVWFCFFLCVRLFSILKKKTIQFKSWRGREREKASKFNNYTIKIIMDANLRRLLRIKRALSIPSIVVHLMMIFCISYLSFIGIPIFHKHTDNNPYVVAEHLCRVLWYKKCTRRIRVFKTNHQPVRYVCEWINKQTNKIYFRGEKNMAKKWAQQMYL